MGRRAAEIIFVLINRGMWRQPSHRPIIKRDCDFALYAERNLVERFFQFIKQFRGIATRYEKTARNFLAGLQLVCALAWLK